MLNVSREQFPNGLCPLCSTSVIVEAKVPAIKAVIGPAGASAMSSMPVVFPCVGDDCQLWDGFNNMCSLKSLEAVKGELERLEPSKSGQHAIEALTKACDNLCDVLGDLGELIETRKPKRRMAGEPAA